MNKNKERSSLELMGKADKLVNLAKSNGFGSKKENPAKQLVRMLKEAGDISGKTLYSVKKGIKHRNDIGHPDGSVYIKLVDSDDLNNFSQAAKEVEDAVAKYLSEDGVTTEI